ncbi:kinase-like domain-containing protein [Mycena floridula]|nr:kinase-like domain-containing protein [Mycena floridula]
MSKRHFSHLDTGLAEHRVSGRSIPVALKVFRVTDQSERDKALMCLKKEAAIWMRLRCHPNIAEFYGVCLIQDRVALVSLWYNNGPASKYVVGKDVRTKLLIIRDIAYGIQYLHSQNIVHGDIKGNNVLITDGGRAVVTDFGLSQILEESTGSTSSSQALAGAARWLAPELFMNCTLEGTRNLRSFATDIWALGCTVYEVLTENIPYADLRTWFEICKRVLDGGVPLLDTDNAIHELPGIRELLCECWASQPSVRLTIDQFVRRLAEGLL